MNNNKVFKSMVTASASYFMCLLMVMFLSCKDDNESADGENALSQYLMLEQNGLSELRVSASEENYTFALKVKRVGNNLEAESTARLVVWSEADLVAYNDKENTSYALLPTSLYNVTPQDFVLSSGVKDINVDIEFDPSEIFSKLQEENVQYVIALRLASDDIKIKSRQRDVLIALTVDYPKVGLADTNTNEVSVNEEITNISMTANLKSQLSGEAINSWWNFSCKLNIPENADALVVEYNKQNDTDYELLPMNSYNLGESFVFKEGSSQATCSFTIIQSELEVKYYVLPLCLAGTENDNVAYDDAIHYMVVARSYRNPVISDNSAPDPTVIRAKDGYFYLYATESSKRNMPVYRSKDLVNWNYIGTAFTNATRPSWEGGGALWAPEIRYINGQYVLYYSWAKLNGADVSSTGVAVSDKPWGPFKDKGALLKASEFGANSIDQFYIEEDGKKYLFWGSFKGIFVTELTDDGFSVKRDGDGIPVLLKKVCGTAFEGVNIYKKDGYYYLFASIGSCCAGLNSSYQVVVGRSKDLLGNYVDKKGQSMLDNSWELVLGGNITRWIGPGHNSIIIQDDEGTDWMIYHSYEKEGNALKGGRFGMLDRLQWEDGWPCIKNCIPSNSDLVPVFK